MSDERVRSLRQPGSFEDERTPITQPNPVEQRSKKRPCLVRLTGAQLGEVVVIDREIVIGREQEHGISLPHDRGVSRQHAKIIAVGEGAVLIDLGSTNGTFVDGVRIKERVLGDGEKIRIGQTTVLKFARYDDAELKMQRRLVDEALRDGMTRVFNRRYFMERLEAELGFAERHASPVSLVLFDLDHFKLVNDHNGHLEGDRILCELAAVCMKTLRHEDVLARYGGEEFVAILRGIRHDGALRFAERLRRAVELAQLGGALSPRRAITISVGVATFGAAELSPLSTARERIVAAADAALYRAKHAGRNCVAS